MKKNKKLIVSLLVANSLGMFTIAFVASANQGGGRGEMSEEMHEELIAVCEDRSEGEECAALFEGKSISGVCQKTPRDDEELVCMPERPRSGKLGTKNEGLKTKEKEGLAKEEFLSGSWDGLSSSAEQKRAQEQEKTAKVIDRLEGIVEYLNSEGVDTDEIQEGVVIFQDKTALLIVGYDDYIELLKNSSDIETLKMKLEEIRVLANDMKTYFRETLRGSIADAISEIN